MKPENDEIPHTKINSEEDDDVIQTFPVDNEIIMKKRKRIILIALIAVVLLLYIFGDYSIINVKKTKNTDREKDEQFQDSLDTTEQENKEIPSKDEQNSKNALIETNDYYVTKIIPRKGIYFTEGLFFDTDETLIESTGLEGQSHLYRYKLDSPDEHLWDYKLDDEYFGEGVTLFNSTLYMLTYRNRLLMKFDYNTMASKLQLKEKITLDPKIKEGWGMTNDDHYIYVSDSTSYIKKIKANSENFEVESEISVVDSNKNQVVNLNELEFVHGKIYSNVFLTNKIVIINPETGIIEKQIDFSQLEIHENKVKPKSHHLDVLNGIAYNRKEGFFVLTGKFWTNLYVVRIK